MILSILPTYDGASAAEQDSLMKVKLKNYLGNQSSITLTSNGKYQLADGSTFMESGEEIQVKVESAELVVYKGSNEIGTYDTFSISPKESESLLYINNRSYHGSFNLQSKMGNMSARLIPYIWRNI